MDLATGMVTGTVSILAASVMFSFHYPNPIRAFRRWLRTRRTRIKSAKLNAHNPGCFMMKPKEHYGAIGWIEKE